MHQELRDVGAMRLVWRPRRMQRHAADNPVVVSRDEDNRAWIGAFESPSPPLAAASTENGLMKLTLAPPSTAS